MKEFFGLKCKYEDMSPVLIPAGYTRDYIDGKITAGDQLKDVHAAFQAKKYRATRDAACPWSRCHGGPVLVCLSEGQLAICFLSIRAMV